MHLSLIKENMGDKWSKKAVQKLIEQYEKYPCMYDSNEKKYKDRNVRNELYKKIADNLEELYPECTANDVKKKLNTLRTQYSAEKRKILQSRNKSGSSADEICCPKVYWYEWLSFLDNAVIPDESEDMIRLRNDTITEDYVGVNVQCKAKRQFLKRKKNTSEDDVISQASKTVSSVSTLMEQFSKSNRDDDEFDIFGKYIGSELRLINQQSKNRFFINKIKRNIQQTIVDAWTQMEDESSRTSLSSSQSFAFGSSENVLLSAKNEIEANITDENELE